MDFPDPEKVWRVAEEEKKWRMRESYMVLRSSPDVSEEEEEPQFEEPEPEPVAVTVAPPPAADFFSSPPLSPTSQLSAAAATTWKSFQSLTSFTTTISSEINAFIKNPAELLNSASELSDKILEENNPDYEIVSAPVIPAPEELESPFENVYTQKKKRQSIIPTGLPKELQDIALWGGDPKEKVEPLVIPGFQDAAEAFSSTIHAATLDEDLDPVNWDEEQEEEYKGESSAETLARYAAYLGGGDEAAKMQEELEADQQTDLIEESRELTLRDSITVESSSFQIKKVTNDKNLSRTDVGKARKRLSVLKPKIEDITDLEEYSTDSTITFYQGFRATYPNLAPKRIQHHQQVQSNSIASTFINPAARLLNFYAKGGVIEKSTRSSPTIGLRHYNSRSSIEIDRDQEDGGLVIRSAAAAATAAANRLKSTELLRPLPDSAKTQAVSITNIAKFFSDLLNQRDAILENTEQLEDTKKLITEELNRVEELLTELTKRKEELIIQLKDISDHEEEMKEILHDVENKLNSITKETVNAEKKIRTIKDDSAILDIAPPAEILPDTCIKTLYGHEDSVECVDFDDPFGTMVSGSADKTVRIWDLGTYRCHAQLIGHTDWVRSVQIQRNIVMSGSNDNTIRQWDISRLPPLPGITSNSEVAPSIPYCIFDSTVDEESADNVCVRVFRGHTAGISSLQFDSRWLISGSEDKTIRQWDMNTGQQITVLKLERWTDEDDSSKIDRFFLGDTRDPISFATSTVAVTPSFVPTESTEVDPSEKSANEATNDIEDAQKVTDDDAALTVIGSDEGETAELTRSAPLPTVSAPVYKGDPQDGHIGALQFWQHALAAGYGDGVVRLWDLRSGKCHRKFKSTNGHYQAITALKFDSSHIATGSLDKTIKVWDIRTGDVGDVIKFDHPVNSLHMDISRIVAGTGGKHVNVYNRATSSLRGLEGHSRGVRSVRCIDDTLITGSMDCTTKVWRVR